MDRAEEGDGWRERGKCHEHQRSQPGPVAAPLQFSAVVAAVAEGRPGVVPGAEDPAAAADLPLRAGGQEVGEEGEDRRAGAAQKKEGKERQHREQTERTDKSDTENP